MLNSLARIFPVLPGERQCVYVLFTHYFLVSAAVIAGKSARDAFFLTRYDKSILPLMYLANAVCVALAMAAFSRLIKRVNPGAGAVLTSCVCAGTLFLIELNLDGWMVGVLYVWMEVIGAVVILQSWMLTGNAFDPRQAKRLFGVIAAGGSIAAWAGGVSIAWVSARFGSSSLITLVALALAVSMATGWYAARFQAPRPKSRTAPVAPGAQKPKLSPYVTSIAILIAATSMVSAVIQYRFQVSAASVYPSRDDLVAFFGHFYAWSGAASLASQLFLSGFLLSRFGVIAGLFVLPASFTVGSVFTLLSPSLWSVGFGRFSDLTFKFTVNNSSLEMLWLPVPPAERQSVKPFIGGTVKAISEAGTATLMFVLVKFTPAWVLSVFALLLCGFWLLTVLRLRHQYRDALLGVIEKRQLDAEALRLTGTDPLIVQSITRSLQSSDPTEQMAALGFLDGLPLAPWRTVLQDLTSGPPEIRERLLALAAHDASVLTDDAVLEIARSGGASASAAVGIAAERGVPGLADILSRFLQTDEPRISVLAARTMLRHNIGDSVEARSALRKWLNSNDPAAISQVLQLVPRDSTLLPAATVRALCRHPHASVRCAAIQVVAARKDFTLLPEVTGALADPRCGRAARLALAELPSDVVVRCLMSVVSEATDERSKSSALRALREYANTVAEDELASHLKPNDLHAWLEFADLLRAVMNVRPLRPNIAEHASRECRIVCENAYLLDGIKSQLCGDPDAILLSDHFDRRYALAIGTTLRLASLRYPSFAVDACLRALSSDDRATIPYVLELLETTFEGDDKRLLAPLIEPGQLERRRAILREMFAAPQSAIEEHIFSTATSTERWEAAVGRDYLARKGKLARAAVAETLTTMTQERDMHSILEKTIMLKCSELFGSLPAENLAALSAIATELRLPAGAVLFREGSPGDSLYVVTSGRVRITKNGLEIAVLGKGTCFGEMAVLDQARRSADAVVADEAVLLQIGSEEFYEVLAENPALARDLIRLLSRRLREATDRIARV
jgi:CRP-like cAMP-binding protein/ATP/ADP translocase